MNDRFSYLKAPDYSGSNFTSDQIFKIQQQDKGVYVGLSQSGISQCIKSSMDGLGVCDNNNGFHLGYDGNNTLVKFINTENTTAKIFVKDNGIGFVRTKDNGNDYNYEQINRIEFFGLTSNSNFPVPPYNDSFFDVDSEASIKPQPQVLRPFLDKGDETTLQFGLFAKVGDNNPGVNRGIDNLTGFTSSTQNYQIIEHINFINNQWLSLNDAGYNKHITPGTPHYLIHIVDVTDNKCPSQIYVTSSKQHVQNIVIISGKSNYGRKVDNILNRSSLTGIADISYTKNNQYYFSYGEDNIYSIMFFKFNDTDDSRIDILDVNKDNAPYVTYNKGTGGNPYIARSSIHYVSYVNYYSSTYPYNTNRNDYENYYEWDGGTSSYTHIYWNATAVGGGAWETVV